MKRKKYVKRREENNNRWLGDVSDGRNGVRKYNIKQKRMEENKTKHTRGYKYSLKKRKKKKKKKKKRIEENEEECSTPEMSARRQAPQKDDALTSNIESTGRCLHEI